MSIELQYQGNVAVLTLNRPQALNALSFEIIRQLDNALDRVADSDARALIITGAGERAFCAGADIAELRNRDLASQHAGARQGQSTFSKIARLRMPSIALINGFAFGGGLELALSCTFRLATDNAKMAQPEIKLGLIPGYGGSQRLPRIVGEALALELILTGRSLSATEALQAGLVSRVVSGDPLAAALKFAQGFSAYSLPVLALAREAVMRAGDTPLDAGLKIEADLSTLAYQTRDAEEGMAAFAEKRSAVFNDA